MQADGFEQLVAAQRQCRAPLALDAIAAFQPQGQAQVHHFQQGKVFLGLEFRGVEVGEKTVTTGGLAMKNHQQTVSGPTAAPPFGARNNFIEQGTDGVLGPFHRIQRSPVSHGLTMKGAHLGDQSGPQLIQIRRTFQTAQQYHFIQQVTGALAKPVAAQRGQCFSRAGGLCRGTQTRPDTG
mgnify:CR=1 FL=1